LAPINLLSAKMKKGENAVHEVYAMGGGREVEQTFNLGNLPGRRVPP